MDSEHNAVQEREQRLDELVVAYVKELEAGRQPDRQALLAGHPDLAAELAGYFADQDALGSLATPRACPQQGTLPALERLGDFRIVREVGRGGMGVVYEAEQVSLGRRVALKVLPFAATMDPRQLQRFHNEARAAAGLHHTNIVPVYGVGSERGVHYYAMQLIDGRTLADFIAEQRGGSPSQVATMAEAEAAASPTTVPPAAQATSTAPRDRAYFRQVAEWGIQAAEALDCAHSLGVVHRDVKPANLLVDATGRLWVTDFGLAQVQSDARLTMTGDLVGTLRYMSPEQALAKRVVVDHRTDVYSLGATLYELLTLKPAFDGADRQELLRQIAFEDPGSPQRLNRAIPTELETVVLKALEKNPAERYATAKELAEDLRRWREDRPIRAQRPSLWQRARKLARRHRAAATAAVICLLVLLVAGGGNLGWVLRDRASRQDKVREALDATQPGLEAGNPWDSALTAAVQKAEAQLGGGAVGEDWRRRVNQLRLDVWMLAELESIQLDGTAVRLGHFDNSAQGAHYLHAFRAYGIDVALLEPEEAAALIQHTAIREHLAHGLDDWASTLAHPAPGGDRQAAQRLLAIARRLDADAWRNRLRDMILTPDYQGVEELVRSAPAEQHRATSRILAKLLSGAVKPSNAMLELLRRAQQRFPADFWINHNLAYALMRVEPPRVDEAIAFYRAAVAVRPQSPGVHLNLAVALRQKGDRDGAMAETREALRLKSDYANAHFALGLDLRREGDLDGAIAEYREAIRIKEDYAEAHNNLGIALYDKGDLDGAIAEYREAIRAEEGAPEAHNNLGNALHKKGDLDGAIAEYRAAIGFKKDYPLAHNGLAGVLREKGNTSAAITEFREAIRIAPDFLEAHVNFGVLLLARDELDGATKEFREAIRIKEDYAEAHSNLGAALYKAKDLAGAVAACRQAIRLMPDLAGAHSNLGMAVRDQGRFAEALAHFRRGHELGSKLPGWDDPSGEWVRQCERLVELDAMLPRVLKGELQPASVGDRVNLAELCLLPCKSLPAAAVRLYAGAFAEQPGLADDLQDQLRYDAACAATLAGCGRGKDADQCNAKERARLRRQALDWLHADLAAYRRLLEKEPDKARPLVSERMQHWQQDKDFAGVQGPEALAKLPEAERQEWQKLWADVADTLARAGRKAPPEQNSVTK